MKSSRQAAALGRYDLADMLRLRWVLCDRAQLHLTSRLMGKLLVQGCADSIRVFTHRMRDSRCNAQCVMRRMWLSWWAAHHSAPLLGGWVHMRFHT